MRHFAWTALVSCALVTVSAQIPPAPAFDVTAVKRNVGGAGGVSVQFLPSGRFTATNISLRDLIATAYGTPRPIPGSRIIGGPDWIAAERYDVQGVASGPIAPDPTFDGMPRPMFMMLRSLLAERFQLKVRSETQEQSVYTLVQARAGHQLGPRLRISATGCAAMRAARPGGAGTSASKPACSLNFTRGSISAQGMSMEEIIRVALSRYTDRPVRDGTGLSGEYDFDLEWSPEVLAASQENGGTPPATGASLFTAVQEQLGLKLEPSRGPIDVLVIDHIERPSEN